MKGFFHSNARRLARPKSGLSAAVAVFFFVAVSCIAQAVPTIDREGTRLPSSSISFNAAGYRVETVAEGLDTPWDLEWDPEGYIWFSERPGRISMLDPKTGKLTVVFHLEVTERGESGLLGIALHPNFTWNPTVYAVNSYSQQGKIFNRLISLQWNGSSLLDMEILVEGVPGNTYHDGSRLLFGMDDFLYWTTGDAGQPELAQDKNSLAGKVLRMTDDGSAAPGNPFDNRIFTFGHRNPQGIVADPDTGRIYITEHGPSDNDEVSILSIGGNYGWPSVHGFVDGDVRGETAFARSHKIVEPIVAWTPTIAPAGAELVENTLFFTTLKGSALIRLELSRDGREVVSQTIIGQGELGRLRDVLAGADGALYLATSNRDGRGRPAANDDRIVRLVPTR